MVREADYKDLDALLHLYLFLHEDIDYRNLELTELVRIDT